MVSIVHIQPHLFASEIVPFYRCLYPFSVPRFFTLSAQPGPELGENTHKNVIFCNKFEYQSGVY